MTAALALRNTLTRRVAPVRTAPGGRVTMYTCGPTVYRPVHLGNLRSFLLADLVRRALTWCGLEVRQVVNITDVGHMTDEVYDRGEDKMLLAAADEGLSPAEIAQKYTAAFHRDTARVNIAPAAAYPRASEHVDDVITLVERLLSRGHAYEAHGTVYFSVESFPAYGRLSRNAVGSLRAGHRLEHVDHHKRHHADFVLWKAAGPRRVVRFPSPWGDGYPGWHVECSAMSLALLGERVDVHTGGVDLVFPHHEDEIAQSEAAVGHRVVGHWVHGAHLHHDGHKMAKSAGNVMTLDDVVEAGHHPLAFRYLCLTARYRRPLALSPAALSGAATALDRLRQHAAGWGPPAAHVGGRAGAFDDRFRHHVLDDLDLPHALPVVWDLVGAEDVAPADKATLLADWDNLLGLDLFAGAPTTSPPLPERAAALLEERSRARAEKRYADADDLRTELARMGVDVSDTPDGTKWSLTT